MEAMQLMDQAYPRLYATINLHNQPFTVTRGEIIWTHRLKDVQIGDVLRLDKVREVGCEAGTIKGTPWIRRGIVVTATVLEHGHGTKVRAEPRRQRKGRRPLRTIKPCTTLLRVRDISIDVDEVNIWHKNRIEQKFTTKLHH